MATRVVNRRTMRPVCFRSTSKPRDYRKLETAPWKRRHRQRVRRRRQLTDVLIEIRRAEHVEHFNPRIEGAALGPEPFRRREIHASEDAAVWRITLGRPLTLLRRPDSFGP